MRIIGYARVSKREMAEDSHALEQQIDRLKRAGAEQVYVDIESGYKNRKREKFEEVLELVKSKSVNEVLVTRLDRFSRKGIISFAAFEVFIKVGVTLRALDEQFDLNTVAGRTHAGILVVLAQAESERISERSRHGWDYLRRRQVAMNPPFGYVKCDDSHKLDHAPFLSLIEGRLELSKAAIARDVIDTFLVAQSLRSTIKRVNIKYGLQRFNHAGPKTGFTTGGIFQWSSSGLRYWLTNPVLCGHLVYLRDETTRTRLIANTHPEQALMTELEFNQIQEIIDHNRKIRGWGFRALKYPLSGLVFCAECGGSCYSLCGGAKGKEKKKSNYYYFQCKNYRMNACSQKKSIRMDAAESALVDRLTERATQIAALAATPEQYIEPTELQQLKSQLAGLQQLGSNPAITDAIAMVRQQIEVFTQTHQQQSTINLAQTAQLVEIFSDRAAWENSPLDDAEKRQVYRDLVSKIVVKSGQVIEIVLKI